MKQTFAAHPMSSMHDRFGLQKIIAQYSHPISRVEEGNDALRLLFIVHVRTSVLARKCCLFVVLLLVDIVMFSRLLSLARTSFRG